MQSNSRIQIFLKNKWVRLVLIIDILIVITITVITVINSLKSSALVLDIAPLDATLSIGGDTNYQNGTYKLFPGDYEIIISHENLNQKVFNVTLPPNSTTEISTFLSASGNFDFYELKENYDSFLELSSIASAENNKTTDHDTSAESFIREYNQNIDLYNSFLPYQEISRGENNAVSTLVTITPLSGDDTPCKKYLCISVSTLGIENPDYVKDLLISNGFNLEYLEIQQST